jgi:hypothetical protein
MIKERVTEIGVQVAIQNNFYFFGEKEMLAKSNWLSSEFSPLFTFVFLK